MMKKIHIRKRLKKGNGSSKGSGAQDLYKAAERTGV